MDTYAVVAAVLLQVLMGLYGVISEPEEGSGRVQRALYEAQMVLLSISVLSSTFCMVMFLLNKIYAVTALGMYKDVAYAAFRQATAQQRVRAFWSLITAMVTFLASFSISLGTRLKGRRGWFLCMTTLSGGAFMVWEWTRMMMLASKYIFS